MKVERLYLSWDKLVVGRDYQVVSVLIWKEQPRISTPQPEASIYLYDLIELLS